MTAAAAILCESANTSTSLGNEAPAPCCLTPDEVCSLTAYLLFRIVGVVPALMDGMLAYATAYRQMVPRLSGQERNVSVGVSV